MWFFASIFANCRRIAAACCGLSAVAIPCLLNTLLPPGTRYRFEIGWTLLVFAIGLVLFAVSLLYGERIMKAANERWLAWSPTKRIIIGVTTYIVVGIGCHAAVDLYEACRWILYAYLPPSISWWFQ